MPERLNFCRTCKHWAVNLHAIGMGNCMNVYVHLRVQNSDKGFATCQDFGCVLHEAGVCKSIIHEPREECIMLKDFLADRHMLADVIQAPCPKD